MVQYLYNIGTAGLSLEQGWVAVGNNNRPSVDMDGATVAWGTMTNADLLDEIEELNLAYLLLAHRMLHKDRTLAMFRLKIDDDMADLLSSLNARQLAQLARTSQLLCHFGHEGAEQLRQVTHNQRDQGLASIHAALRQASGHECSASGEGG